MKQMIASLSQTSSAAMEIQNNTKHKKLKNWAWLGNLPQYTDFESALTNLEEQKQSTPLVQQLLLNKCDVGVRHVNLKCSAADSPSLPGTRNI